MPANTPWKTTNDLIEMVQRKIAVPIYQGTFSNQDIINFLNEEMTISQLPSVLSYHEEYYVTSMAVPLVLGQSRYPIPNRAVAMRLRDIKFQDQSGNIFDMTQIKAEDKAFFQQSIGQNEPVYKFYIEGNDIVLTPKFVQNPTGGLVFYFYIRPNQLVEDSNAALISTFTKNLVISNNAQIIPASSSVTVGFTVFNPSLAPQSNTDFLVGATAANTATNLAAAITSFFSTGNIVAVANSATVTVTENDAKPTMAANINNGCYTLDSFTTINFTGTIPTSVSGSTLVDILQYMPGHTIRSWDIKPVSVGTTTMAIADNILPQTLLPGDYICAQNQCIIPYLPPDLHIALAERACARLLAAQGDTQGLQAQNAKIQEIDQRQNQIIADRSESTPIKLNARKSILRYTKMSRRFNM